MVTAIDTTVISTKTPPTDCPSDFHFTVGPVSNAQLPIYVEVTECQSGVDMSQNTMVQTSAGPFGKECVPGGNVACGAPGQNQNNPSCVALIKAISKARTDLQMQCANATALNSQLTTTLTAAGAMQAASIAIAAVAAACVGSLLPWVVIVGIALFVTAGVFSAIATGLAVWGVALAIQLGSLQGQMGQERKDLAVAIQRLPDVCCNEFIPQGFQDIPSCPV